MGFHPKKTAKVTRNNKPSESFFNANRFDAPNNNSVNIDGAVSYNNSNVSNDKEV